MLARTHCDKYCAVLAFPQVGCAAPYLLSTPPTISARWQQHSGGCP